MLAAALAESSGATHLFGERAYLAFCEKFSVAPIPTSVEMLVFFFVASLSQDRSASTAHTYLAAVRSLHLRLGLGIDKFTSPSLALVTRGIKRSHAVPSRRPRLPMTIDIITRIRWVLPAYFTDGYDRHKFWCALTLAFFGFLRVGKRSNTSPPPRIGDISRVDHLVLRFRSSKTDPFSPRLRCGCRCIGQGRLRTRCCCGVPSFPL